MELRSITEAGALRGKYVIVRASFNIPLEDGKIRNAFRLLRALPTLRYLQEQGARTIIISHIGRKPAETLLPVYEALVAHIPVTWGGLITDPQFAALRNGLGEGHILMAENLRQDPREEANDPEFSALIAGFGEVYVNDGFAEAHRAHASTYGVAQLLAPAYAGITLSEEVKNLASAMAPVSPSLFLLGGAKFETKIPLVEKYLATYDGVFIGGALVHDIMKAKGYEVGTSLVSDVSLKDAPFITSEKLLLPVDVVVETAEGRQVRPLAGVLPTDRIVDAGPETVALLESHIKAAATILWNGTFGYYEGGYVAATEAVARLVAESKAYSVIGGGDTVAAIEGLGLNNQFGFVSIGGGAMLTLLEHGTTEVLELLRK